jgi:hypothetical protein
MPKPYRPIPAAKDKARGGEKRATGPISPKLELGRGANTDYRDHVGTLLFYSRAFLDYQGAGTRTDRFRSKPISAPDALGRGPGANYCRRSGTLVFLFLVLPN